MWHPQARGVGRQEQPRSVMLRIHSLQIPALTGDLLFLLLLLSLKSPQAEWLPISSVLVMQGSAGESTLLCSCVYSNVPCWLYLWLRRLGYGSQSYFFWDWSQNTRNNHRHGRSCCSPRREKTSLWLWIPACNHSKTHLRSSVTTGQISSSQQSLHGKQNKTCLSKTKTSKAAAWIWDLLYFLASGLLMRVSR